MQSISRYTIFPSARIVWEVRHWITRLEGEDLFCNHLSWLAEGEMIMKVMWSRNLLRTAEGLACYAIVQDQGEKCYKNNCRSGFTSSKGFRSDRVEVSVLVGCGTVSPHSRWMGRHIPEERVNISQKNSSPHSRRTGRHIPEGGVDTSQKNSSPHSRRTSRHILKERVATYQKNASPCTRRTRRRIPEEHVDKSEKNASPHTRRMETSKRVVLNTFQSIEHISIDLGS